MSKYREVLPEDDAPLQGKYREVTGDEPRPQGDPKIHPEMQRFIDSGGKKLPFQQSFGENTQNALNNLEITSRSLPIIGQGIKRMFPESDRIKQYKEENPKTSTFYKTAGEYAPFLAIAKKVNQGRNLLANIGLGSSITGSVRALDSAADPDKDKTEILPDMLWGMGEGGLGPLVGKVLSPGTKAAPMPVSGLESIKMRPGRVVQGAPELGTVGKETVSKLSDIARSAGSKAKDAASAGPSMWDKAAKPLTSGMLGIAGATAFPPYGVSLALAPFIPGMARGLANTAKKYPQSTWAHKPIKGTNLSTEDIITAMLMAQGSKSTPETLD